VAPAANGITASACVSTSAGALLTATASTTDNSKVPERSASLSTDYAQLLLGCALWKGLCGATHDPAKATAWWMVCCDTQVHAQLWLAQCFAAGKGGCPIDLAQAIKRYLVCAQPPHSMLEAQYELGSLLWSSGKDVLKGREWVRAAADRGLRAAQDKLLKLSSSKGSSIALMNAAGGSDSPYAARAALLSRQSSAASSAAASPSANSAAGSNSHTPNSAALSKSKAVTAFTFPPAATSTSTSTAPSNPTASAAAAAAAGMDFELHF
jgi:hypothetical protein